MVDVGGHTIHYRRLRRSTLLPVSCCRYTGSVNLPFSIIFYPKNASCTVIGHAAFALCEESRLLADNCIPDFTSVCIMSLYIELSLWSVVRTCTRHNIFTSSLGLRCVHFSSENVIFRGMCVKSLLLTLAHLRVIRKQQLFFRLWFLDPVTCSPGPVSRWKAVKEDLSTSLDDSVIFLLTICLLKLIKKFMFF